MKKTTFKRTTTWLGIVVALVLLLAFLPGLNFSCISGKNFKLERISREHTLKGSFLLFGHGLRYEWHSTDNLSINGEKGVRVNNGRIYIRIGNTEFYTIKAR